MNNPRYGSITTRKGFHDGKPNSTKIWLEESLSLEGKSDLLSVTLELFDLFLNGDTDEADLGLRRNKDGQLRLVKRHLVK